MIETTADAAEASWRARWTLRVLGGFRLTDQSGAEVAGLGKLDRALLIYLALSGQQRHPRAKLATLLWPNRSEALHSLSVSLNALRKAFGDREGTILPLKSDPLVCRFDSIDCDATAFERLVALGTPEALEQAAALYGGNLLDGFDVRSDEFERWLSAERTRLHGLAMDCMARLLRRREQGGQAQQAFDTARRILQLDELCEEAHRAIMRLHLQTGQRAAARQQAQHCEELLRREKIEPEAETRRLIAETRQAGSAAPASVLLPAPGADAADSRQSAALPTTGDRPRRLRFRFGLSLLGLRITIFLFAAVALLLAVFGAVVADNWTVPELAQSPFGKYVRWIKEATWGITAREPPSIAVLPFVGLGDDAVAEDLADGMCAGITNALTIVSEMFVVAHQSVLRYESQPPPVQQIARELDVRYVLEGSVQKWGSRVNIQVSLIDAHQGERVIWSDSFPREMTDIFVLQDEITLEVITNVQATATSGETERITKSHGTRNLQAWLLAGRALKNLRMVRPEHNAAARALYERATELDPDYAGAWDGLAWTHVLGARFGWDPSPEASVRKAAEFAERARTLDPARARVYSLLGNLALLNQDFDAAEELGERAVELEPNETDAAALLAYTLTYTGEPNRALQLIRRAMRLSPYYPDWYGWVFARASRLAGEPADALAAMAAVNIGESQSIAALVELVLAYRELEKPTQARAAAGRIMEVNPEFRARVFMQMQPYEDTDLREREIAELVQAGLPE
jgi:TolB-like protein/DNA-binding SARP family transcriptional activator